MGKKKQITNWNEHRNVFNMPPCETNLRLNKETGEEEVVVNINYLEDGFFEAHVFIKVDSDGWRNIGIVKEETVGSVRFLVDVMLCEVGFDINLSSVDSYV